MSIPYALRPGAGFVLLSACVLSSAAFFLWGWSTPLLDHVGRIELELKLGRRAPLSAEELAQVQRALCQHPEIAEDWLSGAEAGLVSAHHRGVVDNGYAYAVRMPSAATRPLVVTLAPGEKARRLAVAGRTRSGTMKGEVGPGQPWVWAAPPHRTCPTLVELRLTEDGAKKRPARLRVDWGAAP
jgi:hypothetical protein